MIAKLTRGVVVGVIVVISGGVACGSSPTTSGGTGAGTSGAGVGSGTAAAFSGSSTGEASSGSSGGTGSAAGGPSSGGSSAGAGSGTTGATGGSSSGSSGSDGGGGGTSDAQGGASSGDSGGSPASSVNCPAPTLSVGDNMFTLASANGLTYTYTIVIPPSYDPKKPTPTTVFWHALDSSPAESRSLTDIDQVAVNAGNVMVWPKSPDMSWDAGGCCTQLVSGKRRDETVFARELIAQVKSKVCVDPKRIYTEGFSNGGMLTQMLACKMADVFAAASPQSSALTIPTSQCMPARPIPIYMINGTADPLVPYSSASATIGSISVTDTFAYWAKVDQCTGSPVNTLMKGAVSCSTYKQCAAGVQVTLCSVQGMGHCQPGMKAQSSTNCLTKNGIALGPPNNDIDGTQTSMDFLQMFSLP